MEENILPENLDIPEVADEIQDDETLPEVPVDEPKIDENVAIQDETISNIAESEIKDETPKIVVKTKK